MKILVIHNSYTNHGGEDEVVKTEIKMLEASGHQVILYSKSNHEIEGLNIWDKIIFFLKDIYWSNKNYNEVRKIIEDEKPDIAHIHNTFYVISPSAYKACHDYNVPIIQTLHNYRFLCPNALFYRQGAICEECVVYGKKRAVFHRCWKNSYLLTFILVRILRNFQKKMVLDKMIKKFIVLNEFSKRKYIDAGIDEERIFVKSNCINWQVSLSDEIGEYGIFIGTLQSYKGILILIEAWKKIEGTVSLKLVGDGPLRDEVVELIKNTNIEFLGQKSLDEIAILMRRATFVVIPSQCYENFPRVLVEAYSQGIPVIASNIGALKNLVVDKKTGLLFEAGNVSDLTSKINILNNNRNYAKELGRNAYREFQQKYSLEKNIEELQSIYQEVLQT